MQAVGRISSYISKSVYNVSGTFHPFGGSVDIIVVEQPDGSFKSSPWYVRFGKFQGVLKSKEKLVTISVNDVDADFHMYLDNRGEAHFLMEVDVEEGVSFCSPPTSSGEETDGQPENEWRLKSKSCNYDAGFSDANGPGKKSVEGNSALPYPRLGLIFGRKRTMEVERIQGEEKSCDVSRANSLERAEIAANLLDLKWSTNLASSPSNKDNASRVSSVENKFEASDGLDSGCCNHSESDVISVKETVFEANCLSSQVDSGVCIDNAKDRTKSDSPESSCDKLNVVQTESHVYSVGKVLGVRQPHFQTEGSDDKLSKTCFSDENGAVDHTQYSFEDLDPPQLGLDGTVEQQNKSYAEYEDVCGKTSNLQSMSNTLSSENYETVENLMDTQELQVHCEVLLEQGGQAIFHCEEGISTSEGYADGCSDTLITENFSQKLAPINPSNIFCKDNVSEKIVTCPSFKEVFSGDELADDIGYSCVSDLELKHCEGKEADATLCSVSSSGQSSIDERIHDVNHDGRRLRHVWSDGYINKIDQVESKDILGTSLPTSGFVRNNLKASDLDIGVRYNHHITPGSQTGLTEGIMEHKEVPVNSSTGVSENSPNDSSPSRGSTKRSFSLSFKRSRSKNTSFGNDNCIESTNGVGSLESRKDRGKADTRKRLVRTLTPTSEQLASLKLQQGKNLVTFTFSTAMLGKQQVDARIFLWRWDTQIVISDVDGTITRSDLLGQVMPLVGMDWSQSGVAHLFSAIKENGYQLLFLSARSIAQSFHTRQFLLNIKQDGKALPEGPVVISPDGLFPSLFREVIRRAPHEFKIACLEEIKALFPADRNPFYAGFGNRDTDEFSYLKVGIPKGKIFIINPKGEIVVNRRIDTKSYLSLHSLVHGMFPTNASCEQEDFNTWNYWKLPPPLIE